MSWPRRSLERWRRRAEDRGITLEHGTTARRGTVWAARADLERALDALIENALHYSPAGIDGDGRQLPGRSRRRATRAPGVHADERRAGVRAVPPWHAPAAPGRPGSGLGLAIARELARDWGGDVSLRGRAGQHSGGRPPHFRSGRMPLEQADRRPLPTTEKLCRRLTRDPDTVRAQ